MNHSGIGALRASLMASVAFCGVAFASSASAQTAPTEVGELVVTGSRIQRPNLEATQPLLVISSERIEAKGQTNLAEAINDSPSSGIPINPIGDQGSFGTGRNYVNLLNLGTNRTLTLVNGRRFVGSNAASLFTGAGAGGQVDLNGIPTGLVNRTERVFGTGGAVYGSDAIGGVVNIITRTRYEGLEVNGQFGLSEAGDAEEYRARVIGGMSFLDDRLNLMGSYEYNKTEALAFTDRSVTNRQIAFANNPLNTGPADLISGSILIQNRRVPEITAGGLPARTGGSALSGILTIADPNSPGGRIAAQFDRAGNLVPYQTGTFYQTSIASGGDGLNLAKLSSLRSPVDRHVASGFATFEVTPKVRIKAEAFASRVEAVEPFNQPIYNGSVFGGNNAALRMSTSNPFLSAQAKAAILAQPTALPADAASAGDRIFFLNRASSDIGNNKTEGEGDVYRGVLVAEGEFDLFGRAMNWDVSANRGQSKGSFKSPNIVQSRFLLAIDAVRDSNGAIVCRDLTARANGCAPLNLFGEGAPSKAALDYVGVQFQSDFQIDQTVYQANFGGSLFDLPAGALGFNVGYEFRQEESDFKPNEPQRTGVGRSAAIAALSGDFETSEFYGELSAPLFGGDFTFLGMQGLEVEGAYRYIDNSQAGEDEAWSYGLRWKPINDLTIRGTQSKSFRAPAITEVFLPRSPSFTQATDPCDSRNINSGPNPTARRANCGAAFTALGLPANYSLVSNIQSFTVEGATSGNPDLENEIAEQWTLGFVYQPSFIPKLALTFDYVNVKLTKAIVNFNLTSILSTCYDSNAYPSTVCNRFQRGNAASGAQAGQILGRDQAAGIDGPQAGFVNAGFTNFQGFTVGLDWNLELATIRGFDRFGGGDPGTLDFNLDLFSVREQETSVNGFGTDLNRDVNEIGNAEWQWKLESAYTRGPFSAIWTFNYIGESKFNNDFTIETRTPLTVDAYMRHDLVFSYDFAEMIGSPMGLKNMRARLAIENLTDQPPPYGTSGLGVYDVIGRYYKLGVTARF
jgi:outer membrane receptor protein involved in Fe transport